MGLFQVCIIFSHMAQYLEIKWIEFHAFILTRSRLRFLPVIFCLFVIESWPLMDVSISFLEQMNRIRPNFVYVLILTRSSSVLLTIILATL